MATKEEKKPRKKKNIFQKIGTFFGRLIFLVGLAVIGSVILSILFMTGTLQKPPPKLSDQIVLTYALEHLDESVSKPSLDRPLFAPVVTLNEVIQAMDTATKDARVKGMLVRLSGMSLNTAQIQELRNAIKKFRAAKKFAWVYAEGYGASGMSDYYLATAFDEIWMQPVGNVSLSGIAIEMPFIKTALDKIGAKAEFAHKGIYKSAPETFTETGMTKANRDMMTSLVKDLLGQMISDMSEDRGVTVAQWHHYINHALFTDDTAAKYKLVDRLGYLDEFLKEARVKGKLPMAKINKSDEEEEKKDAGDNGVYDLLTYANIADQKTNKGKNFFSKWIPEENLGADDPKIAVIYGIGEIVSSGAVNDGIMDAEKIADYFDRVQKDKDIKAVVFRIDSPGGSPSASETIHRAIVKTKEQGKPVVVSMGGYAASGGYWIATPADKIIAEPATLTGSIGVFGGKFVVEKLWDKVGVNWDSVAAGEKSRMWSPNKPFSSEEFVAFDMMLAHTYDTFLKRVADGRKMTKVQVMKFAEGRVFTGRQAKENGLVDELGGVSDAVNEAKKLAKIASDTKVDVVAYPIPKTGFELFLSMATEGVLFQPQIHIGMDEVKAILGMPDDGAVRAIAPDMYVQ